ncbi:MULTISPECIES: response regulator transcription factor [unclassified Streptomyces]|uniref:helix-turn-helix transcriptional regulator n=1 Tax=unclassified Streptomyces TaxID=2593676 RepID=UPI0013BF99FA|nr:response regulator transcription factor [Streptomyces sp. SID10853]NDZ81349.1 response regulator transcription factor [Streptomyces sp. SID10853]WSU40816.1 response regulator transcription factor [Streptomyces sp. NBC_01089]
MSAVLVHSQGSDRLSAAGLRAMLRELEPRSVSLVDSAAEADVVVYASHVVSGTEMCLLRHQAEQHRAKLVLVVAKIPGIGLHNLVTCRIHAVLSRDEADSDTIGRAVHAARNGEGVFPQTLQGSLVAQLGRLEEEVLRPAGQTLTGLNPRDIEVLRLISEGLGTSEIATKLAYSERTVKNAVHSITARLGARNRAQAVAQAVREGLF